MNQSQGNNIMDLINNNQNAPFHKKGQILITQKNPNIVNINRMIIKKETLGINRNHYQGHNMVLLQGQSQTTLQDHL